MRRRNVTRFQSPILISVIAGISLARFSERSGLTQTTAGLGTALRASNGISKRWLWQVRINDHFAELWTSKTCRSRSIASGIMDVERCLSGSESAPVRREHDLGCMCVCDCIPLEYSEACVGAPRANAHSAKMAAMLSPNPHNWRLSVAPMMDWIDAST